MSVESPPRNTTPNAGRRCGSNSPAGKATERKPRTIVWRSKDEPYG